MHISMLEYQVPGNRVEGQGRQAGVVMWVVGGQETSIQTSLINANVTLTVLHIQV